MSEPAKLGLGEKVHMNFVLLQIPFFLLYTSLIARWSKKNAGRPMNRILYDSTAYFVLQHLSIRQLQAVSGTTAAAYLKWAKQAHIETDTDYYLGDDTMLMWIGPRTTKRVLIYFHGGGFVGPLSDFQLEFWHRVQQSLVKEHGGLQLGVAVLQYSLNPASFPTQLNQAILAVKRILSTGVPASRIYFAGDSAGANLVIQLLSHCLHPSPSVAESLHTRRFAGACLVSPWLLDEGESESERRNDGYDLTPRKCLAMWRDAYLSSIPDSQRIYVQPNTVPDNWFSGLDDVVNRILITTGTREVLHDSAVRFAKTLKKSHDSVQVDVLERGVHCDPIFDVGAKSKAPHPVEKRIVDWFVESIALEAK